MYAPTAPMATREIVTDAARGASDVVVADTVALRFW
jgi:hypothetical protein